MQEVDGVRGTLSASLRSSSTSLRLVELKALVERVSTSQLPTEQITFVTALLFSTYPAYKDRASRQAVQNCLLAIWKSSPPCLAGFVKLLKAESMKCGLAPSNYLVLIEWASLVIQLCSENAEDWTHYGLDTIVADAQLLELLASLKPKGSMRHAALVVTRRALRKLFKTGKLGVDAVGAIIYQLSSKSSPGYRNAVLLGIIAGVCARLRRSIESSRTGVISSPRYAFENVKSQYYTFWVREVIGSKTVGPTHIATAFHDFFASFATLEELEKEIIPALEKALLRAPEVVLNDLVSPLISPLPMDLDFSEILASRLAKPLISNLKSSNADIRNGARRAFTVILSRCQADKPLESVMNEILKPLITSKVPSADQRVLFAHVLDSIPTSQDRSAQICNGLIGMVLKEQNETALAAETQALISHLTFLASETSEKIDASLSTLAKGLTEKKASVQRIWALRSGELLLDLMKTPKTPSSLAVVAEWLLPKMLEIFSEVVSNPISAAQSGLIVGAYIVTSLAEPLCSSLTSSKISELLQKARVLEQAFAMDPKPSFLLNHKVYTKVTGEEDLTWFIRSISACTQKAVNLGAESVASVAWTQAWIYSIVASSVGFTARQSSYDDLVNSYVHNRLALSRLIIAGLWVWYRDCELGTKDCAAGVSQTGTSKLTIVLRTMFPQVGNLSTKKIQPKESSIKNQLIDILVLSRPELLPRVNWIELCLNSGQDPGAIVASQAHQCIDKVNSILQLNEDSDQPLASVKTACYGTFAELAFVAPQSILPLLVNQVKGDLALEELRQYSPTDFAIARTSDGITFIDVLNKKGSAEILDKGRSDYELMKWEAEVRAQQSAKKGQSKKMTADEQSKVQAQLAKEANIRGKVYSLERKLQRGMGTIQALATGPPTEAELWLGPSLKALIDTIEAGVGLLVGESASNAFLACANLVTGRLGPLRQFIGVATLRAFGSSYLPEYLLQESLGVLLTRVLYRLRLAGEQRPFDPVSLSYVLPLMHRVLQNHGIDFKDTDEAEEQVALAIDFLSFHSDRFSAASLPRSEVISVLIWSMQEYTQHYRALKDTFVNFCSSVAANINSLEVQGVLKGTIVPEVTVRTAVLQGIRDHIDLTDLDFCEEIWLATHDDVDENAELGASIWEENALEVEANDAFSILPYLQSKDRQLRRAAARSISACLSIDDSIFSDVLQKLQDEYIEKAKPRAPERDAYGMVKKGDLSDPWEVRDGVALAFSELASLWPASALLSGIKFMIESKALGDKSNPVREDMIESATKIISIHGGEKLEELMTTFEDSLAGAEASTSGSDLVNEAVVILYGALARHLPSGEPRVYKVVTKLLETLSTPSETVQYAVAGCLPPLIRASTDKVSEYVRKTLDELLQSKKYASRRGAAYGLAGIVSGKGITALREYRILSALKGAVENKKDQNGRQGALFAYELFSQILGRSFEPYVIQVVDLLIASFGDTSADVREACLDTSKACFSILSSYGVKEILPKLLEGLEESQWRSKRGACDLLGSMAYLDPQQLASNLPEIIPPLTTVLNDSHKEVRAAANRSLQRFGEVISNPEVKSLVNVLLKALSDPTKYTDDALDALIKVSFVHYLDAPSLALVVRILERGLGDRSATKRKSAQIIGSLAHLTERKDLITHLPILVQGLRVAAVDPVPTTRATASKALGSLMEKLGEDALPDLIPSLMTTLKSDTGAGDRLGSAQALSEVLAGLGTSRLEETLPTILQNVSSSRPAVREGFMSLFIFLPACFGNSFANYLSKIIPPVLAGLADEVESIRETSLRAGRLLVKNFATKSIDLLLPELDRGLGDDSYRIRLSSVELVGDLLFNLTGISGRTEEEEDEAGAAEAGQSLLEVLGEEKRNKILSSLYICRCDTSGLVRSAAINVWKALVASPKTLKELIPTLTQSIIRRLASSNMEQKVIAGNALGEFIRKAGEGVLATLLPTLEEGLQSSSDIDNKQGICMALREIISSSSAETLEDYEKTLISVVRAALVDSDAEVRETAAEAFDSLQQIFGKKAVDQVLPHLLNLLRSDDDADIALSALLTLLTDNTRASIILPNLVPTLLKPPISAFNAKAIASLSEVAGASMNRRLPTILNALMDSIASTEDEELKVELESSFDSILLSADEFDGLNTIMSVMLSLVKHNDHHRRANAGMRFSVFVSRAEVDFSRYYPDVIRVLLLSFNDGDIEVVKATWTALSELMKRLRKEEMESLVSSTRQIVQQVGVPGHNLPGFCLPKGINAILPIFLQGLMNGTAEQRTQSALAVSDIIDRTSPEALRPFVTNITGPLIRVVSERSVELKSAILLTLNHLLEKIPAALKPFLPQLQRTFAKSLADTGSDVLRSRAAKALGTLLTLKPRVDPLIAELVSGTKTSDSGVRNAMLKALYEVVSKAGENISETSRNSILGLIDSDAAEADDATTITNARLLGALIKNLPPTDAQPLIKNRALTTRFTPATILNLNSIIVESPSSLLSNSSQETSAVIAQGISHKLPAISENAVLAAGKFLLRPSNTDAPGATFETSKPLFEALAAVVPSGNASDTRRLSLVVLRTVARHNQPLVRPHLSLLAPPIFASVRDIVIPVKLSAEGAFLALFDVVESESTVFDKYISGSGAESLPAAQKKSMQDYFKRVALRLAGQARERLEAEGGAKGSLGLGSDEVEDEKEVWAVGKVELGNVFESD